MDAPNNPMPPPRNFGGERLKAKRGRDGEEGGGEDGEKEERPRKGGKMAKWEIAGRARPGAALAMAKRAPTGIVASEGKKVVFGDD